MTRTAVRQRRPRLRSPVAPACAALLFAILGASPARATCMAEVLRRDGEFTGRLEPSPREAVARLRSLLAAEQRKPGSTAFRVPQIHAMLAEAGYHAESLDAALADARRGLAAPGLDTPTRHRLELLVANILEARDDLPGSLAQVDRIAAGIPADAPYHRCFLTERGYLRYLNDDMGGAVSDLTAAYEAERDAGDADRRMLVAGILSSVFADAGFQDEAMALADEIVAFYEARNDARGLADGHFRRSGAHLAAGDLDAAEAELRRSLAHARTAADIEPIAAATLDLCMVVGRSSRAREAETWCREAETVGRRTRSDYFIKLAQGYRAGSLAALGRPQEALRLLDPLLDEPQRAFATTWVDDLYLIRSRVREQLGDSAGALADARKHIERTRLEHERMNRRRIDILRVRFEADRKTHELLAEQARAAKLEVEAEQARVGRNLAIVGGGLLMLMALAVVWAVRRRAALQAQTRIARERLGLVSRLTAGVAHEFNNLLTVVQQSMSLLERTPAIAADPVAVAPLQATREAVRAAAALTNQLLALGGHDRPQPASVQIAAFLQRTEPDLRRACGASNRLDIDIEAAMPSIAVDAGQLHHALIALVTNACDAIDPARGGHIRLRVQAETCAVPPDRTVRPGVAIEIVDDGRGMTDAVLHRAREPFFTTKEIGQGAGLGLSVVDAFARQSGGMLRLASTPGDGTRVTLWLPAGSGAAQS